MNGTGSGRSLTGSWRMIGDLLSVFNAMFLGLDVESMNRCELFGFAGSVSQMVVRDDGKRMIRRIGDMSFVK